MLKINSSIASSMNITVYGLNGAAGVRMFAGNKSGEFITMGTGVRARSSWPPSMFIQRAYFPAVKSGGMEASSVGSVLISAPVKGSAKCIGTLSGSTILNYGDIHGLGTLLCSMSGTSAITALLSGAGRLLGSASGVTSETGALSGFSFLFANILCNAITSAHINGSYLLDGSVNGTSSTTAPLNGLSELQGILVMAGSITAQSVAEAVWSEAMAGYVASGTFGEHLKNLMNSSTPPTANQIADAVWDSLKGTYTTPDSMGVLMQEVSAEVQKRLKTSMWLANK